MFDICSAVKSSHDHQMDDDWRTDEVEYGVERHSKVSPFHEKSQLCNSKISSCALYDLKTKARRGGFLA